MEDPVITTLTDTLGRYAGTLVGRGMPPGAIARAAIALALQLYLEHERDDVAAASAWLHALADELTEQGSPPRQAH